MEEWVRASIHVNAKDGRKSCVWRKIGQTVPNILKTNKTKRINCVCGAFQRRIYFRFHKVHVSNAIHLHKQTDVFCVLAPVFVYRIGCKTARAKIMFLTIESVCGVMCVWFTAISFKFVIVRSFVWLPTCHHLDTETHINTRVNTHNIHHKVRYICRRI